MRFWSALQELTLIMCEFPNTLCLLSGCCYSELKPKDKSCCCSVCSFLCPSFDVGSEWGLSSVSPRYQLLSCRFQLTVEVFDYLDAELRLAETGENKTLLLPFSCSALPRKRNLSYI